MNRCRNPRIRIEFLKEEFNNLMYILSKNEDSGNLKISKRAEKLKDKFYMHSTIDENDDGEEIVRAAFFSGETANLVEQLVYYMSKEENNMDKVNYYEIVEKLRQELSEEV